MRGESDTGRQSGEGKRSHTGKVSDVGQQWLLLGCFFLILLAAHLLFVMPGSNDDAVYQDYWRDYKLWDFLKMQYAGWTSRLLVELAVMLCTGAPSWVWYLVNIALILAFVWNASDLFGMKEC